VTPPRGEAGSARKALRIAAVLIAVAASVPVVACLARRATGEGPWRVEQSRIPRVSIRGSDVRVTGARGFTWRTEQDFDAAWFDASYDLSRLDRLAFYYVPLNASASIAHVFVSFGFGPDTWLAVSVEARRRPSEDYELIRAMQRHYELIYVMGDERDIVGKRAWGENAPVYCWPVKISREALRRFFLATMNRAEEVAGHPETYGVLANTCATNVALNAQRAGSDVHLNLDILLSGTMDRLAYTMGVFDTDLPFDEAKPAARIDERLRALPERSAAAFAEAAHRPVGR
jgi:hypothetical protein